MAGRRTRERVVEPLRSNVARDIYKILVMMIVLILVYILLEITIIPLLESFFPAIVSYRKYFEYVIRATLVFGGALIIQRITKHAIEYKSNKPKGKNYRGLYTVIRVVIFGSAIAIFLGSIGVSTTGALLGGTVGGLILSYALQPTISSLLGGILLASFGVVKPKDKISFFSWLFDNPVIGEVIDVKTLTVDVLTIDGNVTQLPISALNGQTQFTNLEVDGKIRSSIDISLPVDAQIDGIMELARRKIENANKDGIIINFYPYFFTKNFNSNVIKVNFDYNNIIDYNKIVNMLNVSYETSYWEMKNRSPQGNNIILGFPVDVPILDIISTGNSFMDKAKDSVGITEYSTAFFIKSFAMNSLKVKFKLKDGAVYDDIANFINSSYEKAYLQLKSSPAK